MDGLKHLVECRCILSQFKRAASPPRHQFPVFSKIDDSDAVIEKYAQCSNCGIVHRVFEIGRSVIVEKKEHMSSIVSVDDIKQFIDPRIAAVLESNNVDVATWEEARFVVEYEDWDRVIVLNRDVEGDDVVLKVMRIVGPSLFKVDTEIRKEILTDV